MSSLLRLESKRKKILQRFWIRIFLFLSQTHLELKRQIRSYTHIVPSKTILDSRQNWAKFTPVFRSKRPKNHTLWGQWQTYIDYIRAYSPGFQNPVINKTFISRNLKWNLAQFDSFNWGSQKGFILSWFKNILELIFRCEVEFFSSPSRIAAFL